MIKKIISIAICVICIFISQVHVLADQNKPFAYVVMDANTGEVLEAANENERYYPASTTKILTIGLALKANRLEEKTVLPSDVRKGIAWDCAHANLVSGEEIYLKDLIALAAMRSANDACNGIGTMISGNQEAFVQLMNQEVSDIGLKNTHFENTNGLHHENHYTTALDLALLMKHCIQIDGFIHWTSLQEYTIEKTNVHSAYTIKQRNPLLIKDSPYYIDGMQSCKTGFTDEAGYCMVSYYQKDGQGLIVVILNENDHHTRVSGTYDLLTKVLENGSFITSEQIKNHLDLSSIQNQYLGGATYRFESSIDGFTCLNIDEIEGKWTYYHPLLTKEKLLASLELKHQGHLLCTMDIYADSLMISKKLVYITLFASVFSIGIVVYLKKRKVKLSD